MPAIHLTVPQTKIWRSPARFRCVVAGRRFGKTFLSVSEMLRAAGGKPDQIVWYVAPTYRMAKRITWRKLKAAIPQGAIASKNESELSIELRNGSIIELHGADNPDSLRGDGLNFLVADEFAIIKQTAWTEVLRPALADKQGKALFISTPKGFNWAYDLFQHGLTAPRWSSWQFTTAQGGNVTPEELEEAAATMDKRVYDQEFNASFQTLAGRIYDKFERIANVDDDVEDNGTELLVGMDFNILPMSAVLAVRSGQECHVFDCIELQVSNTDEMAEEIRRRYPRRRITVCPDPSGKARKTSAAGETDFTILQRYGFQINAPEKAPLVVDRINNTQAMLCDAKGRRRLLVHPRCKPLIKTLEGQTYKEGTKIPDKEGGLDHMGDCLGYLLWAEFNLMHGEGLGQVLEKPREPVPARQIFAHGKSNPFR